MPKVVFVEIDKEADRFFRDFKVRQQLLVMDGQKSFHTLQFHDHGIF